jgi:hypothetical protein
VGMDSVRCLDMDGVGRLVLREGFRVFLQAQGLSPRGEFYDRQVDLWFRGVRDWRISDDWYKFLSLLRDCQ